MSKRTTIKQIRGSESFLTPISVVGVVVPKMSEDRTPNFKLVTMNGIEYSVLADQEWQQVLDSYKWEEVRVRGLLNVATMTIVPQWVVPRGPTGETQRVTDEPLSKGREFVGKIKKTLVDFVLVPCCA